MRDLIDHHARDMMLDLTGERREVPPVVPAPWPASRRYLSFNVNDTVRVKLTDIGRAELMRQDAEFVASLPEAAAKHWRERTPEHYAPDADGHVRFQAWDLMRRLGHLLQTGGDMPFGTDMLIETSERAIREARP